MITIKIENFEKISQGLASSPAVLKAKLQDAVSKGATLIQKNARQAAPKKTGKLQKSILTERRVLEARIQPNTSYALFVHKGTKAHEILPKRKQALFWEGALHPVKRVMHPGTKPHPFMDEGLDHSKEGLNQIFKTSVDEALTIIVK